MKLHCAGKIVVVFLVAETMCGATVTTRFDLLEPKDTVLDVYSRKPTMTTTQK